MIGVWLLDHDLDKITGLWFTHDPNFCSLSWFWTCKEHPCSLSPYLWLWTMRVGSWLWFVIINLVLIWLRSLVHTCAKSGLSFWILNVQVLLLAFENAGGSWLGFDIFVLIWVWPLICDTPLFQILCLYFHSKGAKSIHVLNILIWDFGGCWRFLIGVWYLDHDLGMATGLWYTFVPNFVSLFSL